MRGKKAKQLRRITRAETPVGQKECSYIERRTSQRSGAGLVTMLGVYARRLYQTLKREAPKGTRIVEE